MLLGTHSFSLDSRRHERLVRLPCYPLFVGVITSRPGRPRISISSTNARLNARVCPRRGIYSSRVFRRIRKSDVMEPASCSNTCQFLIFGVQNSAALVASFPNQPVVSACRACTLQAERNGGPAGISPFCNLRFFSYPHIFLGPSS